MSDEIEKVDINDAFENIFFAEEIAKETGFEEGYSAGGNQPLEGYHLGYHRAAILSTQLGYYCGVIEYCLNVKNCFSTKIVEQAKKLHEQIEKFPKTNDETIDILQLFENIKFKFMKLCSLAKINTSNRDKAKFNF